MKVNWDKIGHVCFRGWSLLDRSITDACVRSRRRGVALLMVMTYVVILTATVVSGFMNSQVSFSISANNRDELKAYYNARTAMNLGRLLLTYQYELEKDDFFGTRIRRSNFQMYQILDLILTPFKTGVMSVDVPGMSTIASFDLREAGVEAMGDESGNYDVKVFPEAGRININQFASSVSQAKLYEMCMLFSSTRYDYLFNTAGEDPNKLTRMEQLGAILDWMDTDSDRFQLDKDCTIEEANGDEDGLYTRDRSKKYEVKNAKFTTVDELFEVVGIGDDFMEEFRESLTVYPIDKVNVNLANAKVLYSTLCNAATDETSSSSSKKSKDEEKYWACADEQMASRLLMLAMALEGYQQFVLNPLNLLYLYVSQGQASVIPNVVPNGTIIPFRSTREFYNVIEALIKDNAMMEQFMMYSPTAYLLMRDKIMTLSLASFNMSSLTFDTKQLYANITTASPRVFRVVAVGEYGGTRRTLTAVIDFNVTGGQYLYWREN